MTSDLYDAIEYHLERARPSEFRNGTITRVSGSTVDVRVGYGIKSNAINAVKPHYLPVAIGDDCVITRAHRTAPWILFVVYGRDGSQSTISRSAPEISMGAQSVGTRYSIRGSSSIPASTPTPFASEAIQLTGGAIMIGANIAVTLSAGTGWITTQFSARLNGVTLLSGVEDRYHLTYRPAGLTSFTAFAPMSTPGSALVEIEAFTSGGTISMVSYSQILEL